MNDKVITNVADLVEGNGKTWRENNLAKEHKIAIGRLVECIASGMRLWVWGHGRDCDGTPLYHLTLDRDLIGVEVAPSFPDDFAKKAADSAVIFSGIADSYEDQLVAAKCWLALRHGEKVGKIIWNAGSDDSFRVVDAHMVDEAKEREMFEADINPHSRQRNEVGDYVLPSIQDRWVGWIERANKKEFTTLDTELWKNPHIDINERLEIADGAVAWRNDVIANLRRQLAAYQQDAMAIRKESIRKVIASRSGVACEVRVVPDDQCSVIEGEEPAMDMGLDQLAKRAKNTTTFECWFEETFVVDGSNNLPWKEMLLKHLREHNLHPVFEADEKLTNMLNDLDDTVATSEYQLRLMYRQPLRRVLQICKDAGHDIMVDLFK